MLLNEISNEILNEIQHIDQEIINNTLLSAISLNTLKKRLKSRKQNFANFKL